MSTTRTITLIHLLDGRCAVELDSLIDWLGDDPEAAFWADQLQLIRIENPPD